MNVWENQEGIKELVKTQVVLVTGKKDMCGALIGNVD